MNPSDESPGKVLLHFDGARHRVGLQGESSTGSRMIQIEKLVKDRFVANESSKYFDVSLLKSVDYVSDHKITLRQTTSPFNPAKETPDDFLDFCNVAFADRTPNRAGVCENREDVGFEQPHVG